MKKRKPNRYARGEKFERWVKKIYEEAGFMVYKPVRTKFSKKDIFGMFDLVMYHPQKKILMFLQTTSNDNLVKPKWEFISKNFDVKSLVVAVRSYWLKEKQVYQVIKHPLNEMYGLAKKLKILENTASEGEAP